MMDVFHFGVCAPDGALNGTLPEIRAVCGVQSQSGRYQVTTRNYSGFTRLHCDATDVIGSLLKEDCDNSPFAVFVGCSYVYHIVESHFIGSFYCHPTEMTTPRQRVEEKEKEKKKDVPWVTVFVLKCGTQDRKRDAN